MFVTMEAQARAHPRARPDMPIVLEVDDGNVQARGVYAHWEFEHLDYREPVPGHRYEVMWRAATMAEDATAEDETSEGEPDGEHFSAR